MSATIYEGENLFIETSGSEVWIFDDVFRERYAVIPRNELGAVAKALYEHAKDMGAL